MVLPGRSAHQEVHIFQAFGFSFTGCRLPSKLNWKLWNRPELQHLPFPAELGPLKIKIVKAQLLKKAGERSCEAASEAQIEGPCGGWYRGRRRRKPKRETWALFNLMAISLQGPEVFLFSQVDSDGSYAETKAAEKLRLFNFRPERSHWSSSDSF